jgi:transcriptional regulator with XRE-family HTH domain
MKLAVATIKQLCRDRGVTLHQLLEEAGVSRTAYYSLARKESVLPNSVRVIAGTLGITPASILEEEPAIVSRTRALQRQAKRILHRNPGASFENVWHTLMLLEEAPIERLERSLLRGRTIDLH